MIYNHVSIVVSSCNAMYNNCVYVHVYGCGCVAPRGSDVRRVGARLDEGGGMPPSDFAPLSE